METTVEISHYFLTRKATVAQGNEFPENDSVEYATKVQNVPGGLTMKRQVNSVPTLVKPRTWNFISLADKDVLESVFARSHGSGQPLIMKEDSDDPVVVRIIDANFDRAQSRHHIFGPKITFQTVSHVDPSKGF